MSNHLGRELTSEEVVHHIDEDFTNNSLDNLAVMTKEDHTRHHTDKGKGSVSDTKYYKLFDYLTHKAERDLYHKEWRANNPDKVSAIRANEAFNRRQFPHICERCGKRFLGLKNSRNCGRSSKDCDK